MNAPNFSPLPFEWMLFRRKDFGIVGPNGKNGWKSSLAISLDKKSCQLAQAID
jgi:hypothetical protein